MFFFFQYFEERIEGYEFLLTDVAGGHELKDGFHNSYTFF
jgi:hypothetical protein